MRSASAIALAGGRSARFGSDKALAVFRGAPLLASVLRGLRAQFGDVLVIAKRANFVGGQWPGEPLHVVFHENLHGGAIDRTSALDRHVRTTSDGHVSAKQNFLCHFERSEAKSRNLLLFSLFNANTSTEKLEMSRLRST